MSKRTPVGPSPASSHKHISDLPCMYLLPEMILTVFVVFILNVNRNRSSETNTSLIHMSKQHKRDYARSSGRFTSAEGVFLEGKHLSSYLNWTNGTFCFFYNFKNAIWLREIALSWWSNPVRLVHLSPGSLAVQKTSLRGWREAGTGCKRT